MSICISTGDGSTIAKEVNAKYMSRRTLALVGIMLVTCKLFAETYETLPVREGPPVQTTGTVPHQQIGVSTDQVVLDELVRRTLLLPNVEGHPTIVSLSGALGIWLSERVSVDHPEVIVAGREFTHIHPDGSLHAPLPPERADAAIAAGWAERHPWANIRAGWGGLVMLFTPRSIEEIDVIIGLVVESYNFVTGRQISLADLE